MTSELIQGYLETNKQLQESLHEADLISQHFPNAVEAAFEIYLDGDEERSDSLDGFIRFWDMVSMYVDCEIGKLTMEGGSSGEPWTWDPNTKKWIDPDDQDEDEEDTDLFVAGEAE